MKNIIKRGTSLLLVLAMLLSFAAVVGAADERLPAEGEKPVTLSLDSVVLRQGSTDVQYVPVRLTIEPGFAITGFRLAAVSSDESAVEVVGFYQTRPREIYEDGSVDYDETIGTIFDRLYSNYGYSEIEDPVQKFACANAKGITSEMISARAENGVIKEPDLAGYIGVKVKDGAQSGAYQLSIIPNASRDRDTTKRNDIVFTIGTQNPYTDAYATLNAGTAIVLPEGASLPTVILTDDAFAVPTWEQMQAGEDIYPLAGRMKIVGTDGKLYAVDPTTLTVEKDSVPTGVSVKNNQLEILTSTLRNDDTLTGTGTLRVTNAKAVGADISVTSATVSFKVNRAPAVATHVGFGYSGYNPVPADATPREAESKTAENVQFNLGYGSLGVFDQYSESIPGLTPTVDLKLYSDAFQTELQPEDEVITAKQVTMGTSTLTISKDLKKDVWCEIKTSWTNSDGSKTITGDTVKVHITSNYPQAEKAVIKLTDGSGNPFSGDAAKGTFDIPGGSGRTTIKFAVDKFLDKNGGEMTSATAPMGYTVSAVAPSVKGVTVNNTNKTIEVTSEAVKSAPVEIEIKVVLADNTELTGILKVGTEELPAKITLKKGNSFAISLASYDSISKSYVNDEIRADSYKDNALPTVLPGIGGDEASVVLAPLYVLDQYDQPITNEYAQAANFQLYKVDGTTETKIDSDCVKFEKVGNTHVKLLLINKPGADGKVVLKEGTYKIKAEWSLTKDSPVLTAESAPFTLTEAARVYTGAAEFYGQSTIYVPYKHGTLDSTKTSSTMLGASLKDQYGELKTITSNAPKYTLSEIKLDGKEVTDNAVTVTNAADYSAGQIEVKLSPDAVKYFGSKEEIKLTAAMTAEIDSETVSGIPVEITVKKDASKLAHLKVTGTASDGTTGFTKEATILDDDVTASYNLIVPNEGSRTYTIALSDVEDQYGTALTDKVSRAVVTSGLTAADALKYDKATKTLTVRSDAAGGKAVLTFDESGTSAGHKVELTLNFAQMSFVNSDGADYKVNMWMNTNERTYGQDGALTWLKVYDKILNHGYAKVFIKGENNTPGDEVTDKVKVVVKKDGTEVFDSSKTYTEAPKANAGDYTIELIYVKDEGEGKTNSYPIDSTTFAITPKTVTITANGTITKEYNGSPALPADVTNDSFTKTGAYETVVIDPSALQYESADASTTAINIVLVEGKTTCLTGDAAANYTADLSELKGTITPRKLIVTPNERTFTYGQDTEINAALEREYTVSNNLEGEKAAEITGSMKLTTTSGADVTVYNAGTYNVANKDLSAGTNYEIEFPATHVQWTINRKLLTKVKNSGLPSSGFGVITDEGIIDSVWKDSVRVENGGAIEYVDVSKIVSKDKLSFPADTKYFTTGSGGTEKKYPMPGEGKTKTYTLVVTNPGTVEVGDNYYVDKDTVYEFQYGVFPINASSLIVTLTTADDSAYTEDTYTYNGTEQGPQVQVTYEVKMSATETVTLDLTSISNISGAQATNAAAYTINVTAPTVATGTRTATWKINPKNINGEDIKVVLQDLYYTGEYVDLRDAVVKLRDKTLDVDLVKGVDWDFAGACGTTDAGGSQTVRIYGKGNYDIPNNYRAFTVTLQKAGAALDNTQLEGKQATRNKTNVIELSPKYKLAENPTIEVVGSSEWLDNNSVSAEYKDGKIKITLNVKDGPVTETSKVKLKLTIAETNNYAETVKEFDVKIIEKLVQNFTIAPATGDRAYSYSEGSVQMVATNAVGTVHWQIATDTSGGTAKIDSNGKLELGHPGTVKVVATANETDDYAAASQTYVLTITKGQVTITASSATMTANDPLPGFSATASGLNPNDSVSEVFQTLTASAGTDGKTAGTFRVMPNATFKTGVKDWNEYYELSFVQGTLTVNPAVSVIDTVLPTIIAGNGCANGYASCACESFYDLDASRWYHESIDWAYSLGLMNGTTKSTFGPNAAATRAQTWTMLARIAGQDTRRSSTWYEVGQKWAMNLGITDGTNPMGSLTREQLAAMLYRYVGSPAVNGTLTFTDSANVSAWARNAMIWAVQNGILDGVGGNRLNPKGTTTRAQAAAIFMRFSKLINK